MRKLALGALVALVAVIMLSATSASAVTPMDYWSYRQQCQRAPRDSSCVSGAVIGMQFYLASEMGNESSAAYNIAYVFNAMGDMLWGLDNVIPKATLLRWGWGQGIVVIPANITWQIPSNCNTWLEVWVVATGPGLNNPQWGKFWVYINPDEYDTDPSCLYNYYGGKG